MNGHSHSPGPWHYDYYTPDRETDCNFVLSYYSMDADDEGRARDYGGSLLEGLLVLEDDATNAANARLLAAAPELLEACEAALAHLGLMPHAFSVGEVSIQLRAAIKKASGRVPR